MTFRKKIYQTLKELQADLDSWMEEFTSGAVVLWENPDADVARQCLDRKEKNVGGTIIAKLADCQMMA